MNLRFRACLSVAHYLTSRWAGLLSAFTRSELELSLVLVMDATENDVSTLIAEMRRANELLDKISTAHLDWKISLRNGLLAGLGTAIGATLLVSVLVWVLQPFKQLDGLKPTLDNISRQLERGDRLSP